MTLHERMEGLAQCRPPLTHAEDFGEFWQQSLSIAAAQPLRFSRVLVDHPMKMAKVYDIRFCGFDDTDRKSTRLNSSH